MASDPCPLSDVAPASLARVRLRQACRVCGAVHDAAGWAALPLLLHSRNPDRAVQHRQCTCGVVLIRDVTEEMDADDRLGADLDDGAVLDALHLARRGIW